MITLQRTFTETYVETLKENICLANYCSPGDFPIDKTKVKTLSGVTMPSDLASKMDPKDDYKSAVALFEAYPNLTPLVASFEPFWVYLTHVDLFHYVQERWPKAAISEDPLKYIRNHWFYNGTMKTTLMDLWWSVYCTIDEEAPEQDKYELTKIFFENETFRVRVFGTSLVFRHKEAAIGILSYIRDHLSMFNNLESEGRRISSHFNALGATKQLSILDRTYFYNEMNKLYN